MKGYMNNNFVKFIEWPKNFIFFKLENKYENKRSCITLVLTISYGILYILYFTFW